jgi:hypothetical protein
MNWKFWKKQELTKPTPREFEIPADKVQEIKRLHDAHNANPSGQDNETHFLLWQAIAEVVPETTKGAWTLKHPTATTSTIVERFEG